MEEVEIVDINMDVLDDVAGPNNGPIHGDLAYVHEHNAGVEEGKEGVDQIEPEPNRCCTP